MTKALSAIDRLHVQCHPLSAITLARCSSKQAGPKPLKAVIFDMGGVILPGPFKLFEGIYETVVNIKMFHRYQ